MTDIKKHIKIADAFGKDTKELDEGFVDWVTSTVQKVLGIDDAKADQIAGELRGDMKPAEIKAADEATSGAEQKALTKDQKDAISGTGKYKPQDQDGGVTQGIDQADQAMGANAQGGGQGGAPTGNAGSNLARKLDTKTANLMKAYNDCLLYTSPSPRDRTRSRMPSSA